MNIIEILVLILLVYVFLKIHLQPITGFIAPKMHFEQTLEGEVIMMNTWHRTFPGLGLTTFTNGIIPLTLVPLSILWTIYNPTWARVILTMGIVISFIVNPLPIMYTWSGFLDAFVCSNGPFLNRRESIEAFPNFIKFEKCFPLLKYDFDKIINSEAPCFHDTNPFLGVAKSADLCWRTIYLKTGNIFVRKDLQEKHPRLYELLDDPLIINAFLSILDPGVNIPRHIGYSKSVLRYHLGVKIPIKCRRPSFIDVGGVKYHWKEGKGVMFDDMYPHYVENDCEEPRVVLFIDVRRQFRGVIRNIDNFVISFVENNPVLKSTAKNDHTTKQLQ